MIFLLQKINGFLANNESRKEKKDLSWFRVFEKDGYCLKNLKKTIISIYSEEINIAAGYQKGYVTNIEIKTDK